MLMFRLFDRCVTPGQCIGSAVQRTDDALNSPSPQEVENQNEDRKNAYGSVNVTESIHGLQKKRISCCLCAKGAARRLTNSWIVHVILSNCFSMMTARPTTIMMTIARRQGIVMLRSAVNRRIAMSCGDGAKAVPGPVLPCFDECKPNVGIVECTKLSQTVADPALFWPWKAAPAPSSSQSIPKAGLGPKVAPLVRWELSLQACFLRVLRLDRSMHTRNKLYAFICRT